MKNGKPSHAVEDQKGRAERGFAAFVSKSDVEYLWQGWSLPPTLRSPDAVSAWAPIPRGTDSRDQLVVKTWTHWMTGCVVLLRHSSLLRE